jgi:hypothetical protein
MEILSILEALEELVENAPGVLFSGRCILDRDEVSGDCEGNKIETSG